MPHVSGHRGIIFLFVSIWKNTHLMACAIQGNITLSFFNVNLVYLKAMYILIIMVFGIHLKGFYWAIFLPAELDHSKDLQI